MVCGEMYAIALAALTPGAVFQTIDNDPHPGDNRQCGRDRIGEAGFRA
jgi:hypothetical protein